MADGSAAFNVAYIGLRSEIVERVPAEAQRILDLGAADGTLGAFLLEQRPDRHVVGVEADAAMAEVAAARLSTVIDHDLESIDWNGPVDEGPFDCLIAADVLEHLHRPDEVLQSAVGLLAADATVIVSLPNIRHVSAWWSIYVSGRFPRRPRGLFDETHLRWFTMRDAIELCSGAGLDVVDADYTYRLFDAPGGRVNEHLAEAGWPRRIRPLRPFLGYQSIVVCRRRRESTDRAPR